MNIHGSLCRERPPTVRALLGNKWQGGRGLDACWSGVFNGTSSAGGGAPRRRKSKRSRQRGTGGAPRTARRCAVGSGRGHCRSQEKKTQKTDNSAGAFKGGASSGKEGATSGHGGPHPPAKRDTAPSTAKRRNRQPAGGHGQRQGRPHRQRGGVAAARSEESGGATRLGVRYRHATTVAACPRAASPTAGWGATSWGGRGPQRMGARPAPSLARKSTSTPSRIKQRGGIMRVALLYLSNSS